MDDEEGRLGESPRWDFHAHRRRIQSVWRTISTLLFDIDKRSATLECVRPFEACVPIVGQERVKMDRIKFHLG